MSYEEALADLKEHFGPKKLLDTQDVADALGRSKEAMAMLRLRKQFPIARKHGARVVVSIYDLARYISGEEVSSLPAAPRGQSVDTASRKVASVSNRRPPSLAKALSSFREAISHQQLQIEFQNGVFAGLELLVITDVISEHRFAPKNL